MWRTGIGSGQEIEIVAQGRASVRSSRTNNSKFTLVVFSGTYKLSGGEGAAEIRPQFVEFSRLAGCICYGDDCRDSPLVVEIAHRAYSGVSK